VQKNRRWTVLSYLFPPAAIGYWKLCGDVVSVVVLVAVVFVLGAWVPAPVWFSADASW